MATRRFDQPAGELADQAEADDDDCCAGPDSGEAKRVERDCGRCCERGVRSLNPGGQRHDEIRGHRDDLSMGCVAGADARDAVARGEAPVPSRLEHSPGEAVAERAVLVESAAHLGGGRSDSLGARDVDRLPHEIRPSAGLLEQ